MFDPGHDFQRALHQARVATRKGDFPAANRWMTLAERHLRLFTRLQQAAKLERAGRPPINPR